MLTPSLKQVLADADIKLSGNAKLRDNFKNCFVSTIETTVKRLPDGDSFVITGDIPAMWLRGFVRTGQALPALHKGRSRASGYHRGAYRPPGEMHTDRPPMQMLLTKAPTIIGTHYDRTVLNAMIWERKYEVDSLQC